MSTHAELHRDQMRELATLVKFQREDSRHECGQSALDQLVETAVIALAETIAWNLKAASQGDQGE